MNSRFCLALLTLLLFSASLPAANPREALWKAVADAETQGLPKTAIEKLTAIIKSALRDQAYPEAVKAITRRIAFETQESGNQAGAERITRLEAELAKAPPEMVPAMRAILALWYWQYYRDHNFTFLQRTTTAQPPGKDLATWDLPRLFAEIDRQFTQALAAPELKKIPVADFNDLLEKGTLPDSYRPTMYDFIAHEALAFYASGEQAATRAEDAFELPADSPIFGTVDEFLKWEPAPAEDHSPLLQAIRLFQELLRLHAGDANPGALLRADLSRLEFGHDLAVGDGISSRYQAALKRLIEQCGNHELSAWARADLAVALIDENHFVEAHELVKEGESAFPKTSAGGLCHDLRRQMEDKSLTISTERVWNAPWPALRVDYRNLSEVSFRVLRSDWAGRLRRQPGSQAPDSLQDDEMKAALKEKPVRAWTAPLPKTADYRLRREDLPVPQDLPPGFYCLIASARPDFSASDNQLWSTSFWVSKLAIVLRGGQHVAVGNGFVLDATSGEPLAGVEVRPWVRKDEHYLEGRALKTDANGQFSVPLPEAAEVLFHCSFQGQHLATSEPLEFNRPLPEERRDGTRTFLFTDRSLYRPGQTIQYKGIFVQADAVHDRYHVLGGRQVTVEFLDPNGKAIARTRHQTNDYGSFSGSFIAPRDRLTGRMSLHVPGSIEGSITVTVEEYKRPKFQVVLDPLKTTVELGEKVRLEGRAAAYTGAPIGNARLRFYVLRQPSAASWCQALTAASPSSWESREIAHGTAVTQPDGSFSVEFVAQPDAAVPKASEPIFSYQVSVDVTDTTGETRSAARAVNLGYTSLAASLEAGAWQTTEQKTTVQVSTRSLDGEGQAATGALKIYRLKQPDHVVRPGAEGLEDINGMRSSHHSRAATFYAYESNLEQIDPAALPPDLSDPKTWPLAGVAAEQAVATDASGKAAPAVKLAAGTYRAVFATKDRQGRPVTTQLPLTVVDPKSQRLAANIPSLVAAPKWKVAPGEEFVAYWGSGYAPARAFIEIEHRHKVVQAFWTDPGVSQQQVKYAVTEAQRGGFTLHVTMVRENRAYLVSEDVDVPWSNKELTVKWEHFTSKLEPAQKETWTAVITALDGKKVPGEMVATLYDQSLDAYLPMSWPRGFNVFRTESSSWQTRFENQRIELDKSSVGWAETPQGQATTYRQFPDFVYHPSGLIGIPPVACMPVDPSEFTFTAHGRPLANNPLTSGLRSGQLGISANAIDALLFGTAGQSMKVPGIFSLAGAGTDPTFQVVMRSIDGAGRPAPPDLSKISARANLNETAFFFPQLQARQDGSVAMEFTMPEALTTWRFLGFAHDRELRSGYLEDTVVTAKDLMVEPNAPRFLREGDTLAFTVKVSNRSATRQTGQVRLTFNNARTGESADANLGNKDPDQTFELGAGESHSFSWKLAVPDGAEPLTYKAVGSSERVSDGEEGLLPVLTKRVLVSESLPLPIRGAQTKNVDFQKLLDAGKSETLKSQNLTVQMVSNPSWYAVMALPYLMEFPHECSEQTFNRLYANALARHIAQADPKIRRIFDQWKATPALDSPLEKNQDLKSVTLEETPWLRQAQAESQSRRNVGVLFDDNRLKDETARLLHQLADRQLADGRWPWFPGGHGDDFITLYIVSGFGRLQHLGVKIDTAPAVKALASLDAWIDRIYRDLLKAGNKKANNLTPTVALYLYARSFFLADHRIPAGSREAVDYFRGQAKQYWLKLERQSQGHLAIALKRFGDQATAERIMNSIKENAQDDEETGMSWGGVDRSWWWYQAPIETQALMVEAFDEVMNDAKSVEDCKVWLIKQKQTQDWKTTKATADAIYALLLRGDNVLASDALVQMTIGGEVIKPEKIEAGTGFYEQKFVHGEIKPEQGHISLTKTDQGVSWGSVHWQYLEDMSKVTAFEGTPLKLEKALFTKQLTKAGPVLEPVKGPVKVGDELVVRVTLRTDRDMEYVHLKDHRGSGTEPVNVLSEYKFQDGLAYYESTRDTASHFFIDYLPKGTYVFEYSTRVVHRGKYQTGFASIECMYAPEFNSHSESLWIEAE